MSHWSLLDAIHPQYFSDSRPGSLPEMRHGVTLEDDYEEEGQTCEDRDEEGAVDNPGVESLEADAEQEEGD